MLGLEHWESGSGPRVSPASSDDDWPPVLPVLYRRRFILVLGALVGLGLSLVYLAMAEPTYTSSAEVLVAPVGAAAFGADRSSALNMANERQLVHSHDVAARVRSLTGWRKGAAELRSQVSSSVVGESEVLLITYKDHTARRAQQGAAAYAAGFLEFRALQAGETRDAARRNLVRALDGVERRMSEAGPFAATGAGNAAPPPDLARESFQREAANYHARLAELDSVAVDMAGAVLSVADLPRSPTSPKPVPYSVAGGFLGLTSGALVALSRDRANPRLRDQTDVEVQLGAPVLTNVPRRRRHRQSGPVLVTIRHPHSPTAEAYRRLRVLVQALAQSRRVRTLMVVSPTTSLGKSAVAGNLAVALARAGPTVSLVCADLRRPAAESFFPVDPCRGLSGVLAGEMAPRAALHQPAGLEQLAVLPPGSRPTEPADLLRPELVREVLDERREATEFVIVDGPPALSDPEALLVASLVDGVIIVVDARKTTRRQLSEVRRQLGQAGATVLGAVICNAGHGWTLSKRGNQRSAISM